MAEREKKGECNPGEIRNRPVKDNNKALRKRMEYAIPEQDNVRHLFKP